MAYETQKKLTPGNDETANVKFFEDELFSILDKTTYDKVILVGP